jgi:hypothetical protein
MSLLERLNCRCDKLAKTAIHLGIQNPPVETPGRQQLPLETAAVFYNGRKLSGTFHGTTTSMASSSHQNVAPCYARLINICEWTPRKYLKRADFFLKLTFNRSGMKGPKNRVTGCMLSERQSKRGGVPRGINIVGWVIRHQRALLTRHSQRRLIHLELRIHEEKMEMWRTWRIRTGNDRQLARGQWWIAPTSVGNRINSRVENEQEAYTSLNVL